jgi:hypothetical protein
MRVAANRTVVRQRAKLRTVHGHPAVRAEPSGADLPDALDSPKGALPPILRTRSDSPRTTEVTFVLT